MLEEKRGIMQQRISPRQLPHTDLTEQEKEKLVRLSEISLIMDSYDDIFSDFDPRDYHNKALSQDFLEETMRASRDKGFDGIELKLMIPADKRSHTNEALIKRRLHEHFKKHNTIMLKEYQSLIHKGFTMVILGAFMMTAGAWIIYNYPESFKKAMMTILLEPGGWFFFWEGLNLIIFESKKKTPDLSFYEKMSKSLITFVSY